MRALRRLRFFATGAAALLWRASVWVRATLAPKAPVVRDRHLLIVCWDFPPIEATGAHLPTSLARYACLAGWKVSVVCGPSPATESVSGRALFASLPPGVAIHRVSRILATPHGARLCAPAWTPSIDGGYLTSLAMVNTALRSVDQAPTVILAEGPRFSNFHAARRLASVFQAKLALRYQDEWTVRTPSFVQNTGDDRTEEERCLTSADLVIFVSEGKQRAYRNAFPAIDTHKQMVIPCGWECYFQQTAETAVLPVASGMFTLTFTGRWHTSMAPFLRTLDTVLCRHPDIRKKFRLVMVGNQTSSNSMSLADFAATHAGALVMLPAQAPATVVAIQRASSALLLLNDFDYDGVVPLKTFEYIRSPRPILALGNTGGGADIVRSVGAGLISPIDDAAALAEAINTLVGAPAARWQTAQREAWAAAHDRQLLTLRLLDVLEGLGQRTASQNARIARADIPIIVNPVIANDVPQSPAA